MGPEDIFGLPPAGLDLTENASDVIWAPIIVVIVLTVIIFALRFVAKYISKDPYMKADDYWLILGMIISIGSASCAFESGKHGSGKHIWALKPENITSLLKIIYADGLIYSTAVTCTKLSILLYYRRIFNFKYVYYFGLFLIISYWVTVIIVLNAGCRPLSLIWEQYTNPLLLKTGVCMDLPRFYWQNAIWAMAVDIVILLMPIYPVWTLHTTTANKLAVSGMLALGVFVIGACGARIEAMHHLMTELDKSWYLCPAFAWTCVEPFVGIISACLPTLGPLVQQSRRSTCLGLRKKSPTGISSATGRDMRKYQKQVPKDELSVDSPCSSNFPYSPRSVPKHVPKDELSGYSPCSSNSPRSVPNHLPKDELSTYSPRSSKFPYSPRSVHFPSSPRSPSFFYPRSPGYPYSPRSPSFPYSLNSPRSTPSTPSLYAEEHELNDVNRHGSRNRMREEEEEEEEFVCVDITHELGPNMV